MKEAFKIAALTALCGLLLAGCTDPASMLAGGVKGYCTHNPGGTCSRPQPSQPPRYTVPYVPGT